LGYLTCFDQLAEAKWYLALTTYLLPERLRGEFGLVFGEREQLSMKFGTRADTKSLIALIDSAADWTPKNRGGEARQKRAAVARMALQR
jgi:hypothetical protein